jgi:hypothetical protein
VPDGEDLVAGPVHNKQARLALPAREVIKSGEKATPCVNKAVQPTLLAGHQPPGRPQSRSMRASWRALRYLRYVVQWAGVVAYSLVDLWG